MCIQVQRHRLQPRPLLQLPQLAQMQALQAGSVLRWRVLAAARGLSAQLVQVRWYWLDLDRHNRCRVLRNSPYREPEL
jgi:hypothetical protein